MREFKQAIGGKDDERAAAEEPAPALERAA
jgi:hypothetical protein